MDFEGMDFEGKVVAFVHRLEAVPRPVVTRELELRGAIVRRRLIRRVRIVAIGQGAVEMLADGRLGARLALATTLGATVLSEKALLRELGLLPPLPDEPSALSLDELADRARLDPASIRILSLFDLIQPRGERVGFRDLVTAREVARLLRENVPLADIVASAGRMAQRTGGPISHPLARHKLVCDPDGHLVVRAGPGFADLDGQLRLPLPDAGNPTLDSLFEEAEEAEERGDLATAEGLYRRCIALDRGDPVAPFNLANVLRELGRPEEARVFFQRAVAIDPEFAEAWYNLAGLMEQAGQRELARELLRRAVAADPYYGDPLYNLALWHFQVGEYADAIVWWERYLDLDPDSDWSKKARQGLALCHQHLTRSAPAGSS